MKKVLVTVAALGLVFGVAANALALDQPGRAADVESTTAPRVPEPTAPGVSLWSVSGQWVLAGEPLGVMSSSPDSPPQLYLELRHQGRPVNPLPWLAASSIKPSGS